jgi:hypothetical protein
MKIMLSVPLMLLLALGACKKPVLEVPLDFIPPLVLSTSIHDSLPSGAVKALHLEGITGVKIKHHNGIYASYFEYEADKSLLLKTISALPFHMDAAKADTQCYRISTEELGIIKQKLQPQELENTLFFWNVNHSALTIFECIKPPFRHTIQMTENSRRILHRIELLRLG